MELHSNSVWSQVMLRPWLVEVTWLHLLHQGRNGTFAAFPTTVMLEIRSLPSLCWLKEKYHLQHLRRLICNQRQQQGPDQSTLEWWPSWLHFSFSCNNGPEDAWFCSFPSYLFLLSSFILLNCYFILDWIFASILVCNISEFNSINYKSISLFFFLRNSHLNWTNKDCYTLTMALQFL